MLPPTSRERDSTSAIDFAINDFWFFFSAICFLFFNAFLFVCLFVSWSLAISGTTNVY